ncbi:acyl-CoA dehydrogenase family protein [Streptacidiphilus albus]|uniref:acyl-CoA dehydrogenase family protein n=1 Tax=Streptacidiphilus albus TaxID=105425 RepID=UPI0007C7C268|nr:acyl-CoA dehydrogenase family protein [Streptacidiphilus albus]
MEHAPYLLAEHLERQLGDPELPGTVFNHVNCLSLDEREEFPTAICARLEELGLQDYYVPAEHGGRLESYEHLLQVMRTVARRDLTVAIGHGKTYLGGVCVWVAGTAEQAERLGRAIHEGLPVSLGLTERAHGSDLLAGEVQGVPDGSGGYLVSGEKWLINNATRSSLLSVLTRTDPAGGPRGYSVLLVDKRRLPRESYRHLDKVPTHGIRGADISGIAFDNAPVSADALVGAVGTGLETVLKALQLTRTMCAALSLGAADHALALGLDFARERELYGRTLVQLPQARQALAESVADVLGDEALATVAARMVHTAPGELSVSAAVTKYLLPTTTEEVIARLTRLLGARAFLKGVYADGQFQKVDRDHRIVGLFDGNTLVNLTSLISQFRSLVRAHRRGGGDREAAVAAFRLSLPLPPSAPERLSLVARHGSGVLASLSDSVASLRLAAAEDPSFKQALAAAERLLPLVDEVHAEMAEYQDALAEVPVAAFDTARRLSLCFAAAACLGLWAHTRAEAEQGATAGLWEGGLWLRAVLARLLERLGLPEAKDPEAGEQLLELALEQRSSGRLVSLLPLVLTPDRTATAVETDHAYVEEAS